MEPEQLINLGIVGMHGSIKDRQFTLYGCTGERNIGEEFQFNDKIYVVCESETLLHEGRLYRCPCFLCAMNQKCNRDFLYASGECYWDWRKDGKYVYFKEKEEK